MTAPCSSLAPLRSCFEADASRPRLELLRPWEAAFVLLRALSSGLRKSWGESKLLPCSGTLGSFPMGSAFPRAASALGEAKGKLSAGEEGQGRTLGKLRWSRRCNVGGSGPIMLGSNLTSRAWVRERTNAPAMKPDRESSPWARNEFLSPLLAHLLPS